MVPGIAAAVSSLRGLARIERSTDGAITDGVDVDLEAFTVEARDELHQPVGFEIQFSAAAAPVQIRVEKGGGPGLDYAVGEDFYRGSAHSFTAELGSPLNQAGHLVVASSRIGAQCGHRFYGELSPGVERPVGIQNLIAGVSFLHRDDTEAIGELNCALESGGVFLLSRRRDPACHQFAG